jgi:hypothetical protein
MVLGLKRSASWVDWQKCLNLGPCLHLFSILVRREVDPKRRKVGADKSKSAQIVPDRSKFVQIKISSEETIFLDRPTEE